MPAFEAGERCSNDHFETRFTCPACYEDFERKGVGDDRQSQACPNTECGAPLEIWLEMVPSAVAQIRDQDEEDAA
jgi:hypothetical protein